MAVSIDIWVRFYCRTPQLRWEIVPKLEAIRRRLQRNTQYVPAQDCEYGKGWRSWAF